MIEVGNNDTPVHNSAAYAEDKETYYGFMYELWFKRHPANLRFAESVKDTFFKGGYYKVDITDKFSFLSINTLPYNVKQVESKVGPEAEEQFQWMESFFEEESPRKYIIAEHIPAGVGGKYTKPTWLSTWEDRYIEMLTKHKEKLLIEIAGHEHV